MKEEPITRITASTASSFPTVFFGMPNSENKKALPRNEIMLPGMYLFSSDIPQKYDEFLKFTLSE
jgi:hypothetical protein